MKKITFICTTILMASVIVIQANAQTSTSKELQTPKTINTITRAVTVVNTFEELKSALENNNGVTDITLGADITLSSGIKINPAKTKVTIDGANHVLTESVQGITGTIYIGDNKGTENVTLKNINIEGKDFYGPVNVDDLVYGVTLNYENVNYHGPQLVHNVHGFANFSGTNVIDIVTNGGNSSPGQEIFEGLGVTIAGNFTATHEGEKDSAFWFGLGNDERPFLTIKDDAKVSINVLFNTLFYVDFSDTHPLDITVGKGAQFDVKTQRELFRLGHAGTVDLLDNSSTTIARSSSTSPEATVNLDNSIFKVEPLASFNVVHTQEAQVPIFKARNNTLIDLNKAKEIDFKTSSNSKVFDAQDTQLKVNTNTLKTWHGSDADIPDYQDNTPLNAEFKLDTSKVDVITSNQPDILIHWNVLQTNHLILNDTEETLDPPTLNPINDTDSQLTGTGIPGDTVIITIAGEEIGRATVGEDGRWILSLDNPLTAGTVVNATQTDGNLASDADQQTVTHLAAETTNSFNLGYWQDYGMIIEGQMENSDWDLSDSTTLNKTMKLIDSNNSVALSVGMANTNWYGSLDKYNGFQAILTNEDLSSLADGTYKVQIETKGTGFDVTQDMQSVASSKTTPYRNKFEEIDPQTVNGKLITTSVDNGLCYITITQAK